MKKYFAYAAVIIIALLCSLLPASAARRPRNPGCSITVNTLSGLTTFYAPGTVVCLAAGTYSTAQSLYLTHSGTALAPITYQSAPGGTATIKYTGTVQQTLLGVPTGISYITISGLAFDGNNVANSGLNCHGGTHVSFTGNRIDNAGAGGIITYQCDYVIAINNVINHSGYGSGWASGISFNTDYWSDNAPGFHDIISGNVIAGTVDNSNYHTDGNGIILDSGGNTPPVQITNNIVYMNGGRCIHLFGVANGSVNNNVCYKNGLDLRVTPLGEVSLESAVGATIANNLIVAWGTRYPIFYDQSSAAFSGNIYTGGGSIFGILPAGGAAKINPGFAKPPFVDPAALGQYAVAPTPGAWVAAAFATVTPAPPTPTNTATIVRPPTNTATATNTATNTSTATTTDTDTATATNTATDTATSTSTATATPTAVTFPSGNYGITITDSQGRIVSRATMTIP